MSDLYVRNKLRVWLAEPDMEVPFYDTINLAQNPQDDMWVTADFNATYREKLSFCNGDWMEEGDIALVYSGVPGIGDEQLIEAALADIKTLMAKRDSTSQVVLTERSSVQNFSSGAANQSYQIEIMVTYEYQEKSP